MTSIIKADQISNLLGTTTHDVNNIATLSDVSVAEYNIAEDLTTTNRTLNGDSGWVTHLSVTITVSETSTVLCTANFAHGYEAGSVNTGGRFGLDGVTFTRPTQIFVQGHSSNHSFGAHSMFNAFTNVSAGSHTITLQVRNYTPSTTAIMNNFGGVGGAVDFPDIFQVFYK